MKLLVLSEADCRAVLDHRSAIDIQAQAFTWLAEGRSVEGLRSFVTSEDPRGVAIFNPCFLRNGLGYGVKVVSDFYDNEKRHATRMTGLVALFDGETGHPRTLMEAGYLTDLRTGAGTGLAARYLARSNSRTVAIIGAGRVARNQLLALSEIFDLELVLLSTRSAGRAEDFIRRMKSSGGRVPEDIRFVSDREAVRHADIVVVATTSETPVLAGAWLRPGTFVASVGAHQPSAREVDSETIRRADRLVIDSRADCLDHAGDFMIPIGEGVISRDQVAQIAELVSGAKPGRSSDDEITYYKSIGVPIQDLVTAQHIDRRARQKGIGTEISIGGESE